jgi:tetratricopeptide (TPR) repeat protein
VVVLEDAHWAEPTLLDLLEHVTGFSSGAPILLLCLSRPELLEERPAWAAPQPNRSMVVIEPLAEPESWELVDHLGSKQLPERARARIVEMGEGNPLFLEQLVAVQAEGEAVTMPSRVQAVLAARIDQLDPGDRTVLERASVEGRSFHRGALAELLPDIDRAALDAHLTRLVRKQLIRPDRPELADEEAFRFDHVLIREAAYEAIPKQVRAELHMRYAKWLTGVTSDRESEYEEILGYHLEHAYRFRHELGQLDADAFAAARRAAMLLAAAGRRARARWDVPAARGLLSRAVALLPEADRERLGLLPELGEVLGRSGDYRGELAVVQEALDGADTAGDSRTRGYALLLRGEARMHIDPEFAAEAALHEAGDALRLFEELGDERGQVQGLLTISGCHWRRGQHADQCAALERALALPTATQDERLQRTILAYLGAARLFGITPLDETIRYLESELDQAGTREPYLRIALGRAHAMRGEFESAREIIASFVAFLDEFGSTFEARQAALSTLATIEMLAGDHVAAEEYLKRAFEMLRNVGEKGILASNVTGQLAETIYAQGRYEEAERYTRIAEETAALDHEQAQITWRSVRARALAWQDRPLEGESLAREAVALAEATDNINRLGDAFMALAETLRLCARPNDAAIAAREALSLYEKKGNVVSAETARARLRELHTRLRHVTSP